MEYPYSAKNRLEERCSYMYTPFLGEEFFDHYFSARKKCGEELEQMVDYSSKITELTGEIINIGRRHLRTLSARPSGRLGDYKPNGISYRLSKQESSARGFKPEGRLGGLAAGKYLSDLTINMTITTRELLLHLLKSLEDEKSGIESFSKLWLDLLVQRFEVTKRLYRSYKPGFRKGEGGYYHPELYGLFSLVLALYYQRSQNLKYLNALIKVNDLICSSPTFIRNDECAVISAIVSLESEKFYIKKLLSKKGISG